jgi:hypothetical protein
MTAFCEMCIMERELPARIRKRAGSFWFDGWRIRGQNLRLLADRLKEAGRIGIGARRLRA